MTRRRMVLLVVAAVIVVAIPLIASSCARARDAAEAASQEFRTRMSSGAYGEIVRSAAPGKYTFSALVLGVVKSAPFQMRRSS